MPSVAAIHLLIFDSLEPNALRWRGHVSRLASVYFYLLTLKRSSEAHLRSLFNRFGLVQTCIVNVDKRHAFIKMINRTDAVNARDGMESYRTGEMQLRVSRHPPDNDQ